MDVVAKHHPPEPHSRATKNYPQFCRALQVLCLQESTMVRWQESTDDDLSLIFGKLGEASFMESVADTFDTN